MGAKVPMLVMIQGHEPGARWTLQETRVTTIGRSSRNVINLVNPSLSRFHCEVSYINGLWYVADLNSKKGTFLNGRRVTDREVLKPGDIVRLSKNVFRFDLVDETAASDEAALALREEVASAAIAARLQEGSAAVAQPEAAEKKRGISLGQRVAQFRLVIGVAVGLTVLVGGALAYGHQVARAMRRRQEEQLEAAERALAEAAALMEAGPGRYREALEALQKVVRVYPGQPAAQKAAAMYFEEEGRWLDREIQRIAASERAGDYRDALERSSDLLEGLSDGELRALVQERQEFTTRLARAAYREMDDEANRLRAQGRTAEAVRLYRDAIAKIGVPDLIREAELKIGELSPPAEQPESASPAGKGQPTPEPPPTLP